MLAARMGSQGWDKGSGLAWGSFMMVGGDAAVAALTHRLSCAVCCVLCCVRARREQNARADVLSNDAIDKRNTV